MTSVAVFFPDDGNPLVPDPFSTGMGVMAGGFGVFFVIVVLCILGGVVFAVVASVRKYRVLKDAGIDPLAADAQLAARVMNSEMLRSSAAPAAPAAHPSIEQRLTELDDLAARGVISDAERTAARAAILGG